MIYWPQLLLAEVKNAARQDWYISRSCFIVHSIDDVKYIRAKWMERMVWLGNMHMSWQQLRRFSSMTNLQEWFESVILGGSRKVIFFFVTEMLRVFAPYEENTNCWRNLLPWTWSLAYTSKRRIPVLVLPPPIVYKIPTRKSMLTNAMYYLLIRHTFLAMQDLVYPLGEEVPKLV